MKRMEQEACFECLKQATLQHAQEEAQRQELPALRGTPAQIAWAETLRINVLKKLDVFLQKEFNADPQAIDKLTGETAAHQWIEWRNQHIKDILDMLQEHSPLLVDEPHNDTVAQALGETTLRPEVPCTETVAEIRIAGNTLSLFFPEKHERFRQLVRFRYGFEWNEFCWQRTCNPSWHGTPQDRAVEIGRALLAAGFSVRSFDAQVRTCILSGNFLPECTRWIKQCVQGKYAGWLIVQWGKHEDFYDEARKISRSLYTGSVIVVRPEYYEEILDFAHLYDFHLSKAAAMMIEQARIARETAIMVKIEPEHTSPLLGKPAPLVVPENVTILDEFAS